VINMTNKLFKLEEKYKFIEEWYVYIFKCPACLRFHSVSKNNPYNDNIESPTFENELKFEYNIESEIIICSSFIKDGNIQYLNKSNHRYSGETFELPLWNNLEWESDKSEVL
jgi:hypothetical protein